MISAISSKDSVDYCNYSIHLRDSEFISVATPYTLTSEIADF